MLPSDFILCGAWGSFFFLYMYIWPLEGDREEMWWNPMPILATAMTIRCILTTIGGHVPPVSLYVWYIGGVEAFGGAHIKSYFCFIHGHTNNKGKRVTL